MTTPQVPGETTASPRQLAYWGGLPGAVFPFLVFVAGVVTLALSGTPGERGFWPVLLLGLVIGLAMSQDRRAFCEIAIEGMAKPILIIMILAWMLASVVGVMLRETGFIQALTWIAGQFNLSGAAFVAATFLICCIVSTSTGTSFGTILICGPILYPAGAALGADLPSLAGAVLGGATFGDNISPISDTTIASSLSQQADIGGVVRSRIKYAIPASLIALLFFYLNAAMQGGNSISDTVEWEGDPSGLPMILVPVTILYLLLRGRHLLEDLLLGLTIGVVLGISTGLLPWDRLLALDRDNFTATSFIIEGIDRSLGICIFTILLMGLVATTEASGILKRLVDFSARHTSSTRSAEIWISEVVMGTVMLTTHGVVAILTAADFAKETGERYAIHRYRRANLLDVTASTVPFLFPYFIPVILATSTTATGDQFGIPPLDPLTVGLHNFYSWALLGMLIFALATGYGRRYAPDRELS